MSSLQPENLSDEEFMKYAYLQGLGKLDEKWVEQFYQRLQRMMDEKNSREEAPDYDDGYEAGFEDGLNAA